MANKLSTVSVFVVLRTAKRTVVCRLGLCRHRRKLDLDAVPLRWCTPCARNLLVLPIDRSVDLVFDKLLDQPMVSRARLLLKTTPRDDTNYLRFEGIGYP